MLSLMPVTVDDINELALFLRDADLTLSGLDSPGVSLWVDRDAGGAVIGSTGFELSHDHRHALVRSVAVHPSERRAGYGTTLARFALHQAASAGATKAWLFSRRSGPFWQKLGFERTETHALASALANAHQVQLFVESGQLDREVAWSRLLPID